MADKLLTADETSVRLGISKSTLAYWRQMSRGPQWGKLGKRIFYRERELQEWIDAQFATSAK